MVWRDAPQGTVLVPTNGWPFIGVMIERHNRHAFNDLRV
jgi:hypothetical protein